MRGRPISRILSSCTAQERCNIDDHSSDLAVTDKATAANPDLLEHKRLRRSARRQIQHAVPIWRCSKWGLPCRRCCQPRGGLLPHRFTLTCRHTKANPGTTGGLFSVALSVGLPRPGVTRHLFLLESGLSSPLPEDNKAAIQPSTQDVAYAAVLHAVNEVIQFWHVCPSLRAQSRPVPTDHHAKVHGADVWCAKACHSQHRH